MKLTQAMTYKWLQLFVQDIQKNQAHLNELDTAIGDGDHGTNMVRGMEQVFKILSQSQDQKVSDLLKQVAFALISKVGGASGPLYGTAFLEMSKYLQNQDDDLASVINAGALGIKRRGQVNGGEKTMYDIWQPVAADLQQQQFNQANLDSHLQATLNLEATKGRASYLGERSQGHLDPGAQSSTILFTDLLQVLN